MNLKILLPYKVFTEIENISQIVVETSEGSYGFLPHRRDCVAALVPGILMYESENGKNYIAIDEGVMVKTGNQVFVSVRNALGSADLGKLRELVEKEYSTLDESEIQTRAVMAKLESGFIQSFKRFKKD